MALTQNITSINFVCTVNQTLGTVIRCVHPPVISNLGRLIYKGQRRRYGLQIFEHLVDFVI